MDSYLVLRISHSVPAVLLILGVLVHIAIVWRAKNKGPVVLAQKLRRTCMISLPVFSILAVTLPITGWWLSHLSGRPLSQMWLTISIILMPVLFIFGGLLYGNLSRWQTQLANELETSPRQQAFALLWAVLVLLNLLVTSALMGAKPL
ncbi:DUF2269 family protein [Pseudomonas sp. C27(2019)]|uniref:DUF2269 family protein n=1 Tax=Pseudomonas sp. C27(2019) TaxID=2604941 RepID=UPI001246F6ED|nr:DUF2269 family protein [Pseudomonas sp. C27(2019)]QEY57688.1 DUF2269 family protein [Pseudomonas sp. C27(2019)]